MLCMFKHEYEDDKNLGDEVENDENDDLDNLIEVIEEENVNKDVCSAFNIYLAIF